MKRFSYMLDVQLFLYVLCHPSYWKQLPWRFSLAIKELFR